MDDDDPFDGLTLDDDFVRGASVEERSAAERMARDERRRRIDAEHQRLLRERAAQAESAQRADREDRQWVEREEARRVRRPATWKTRVAKLALVALVASAVWTSFRPDGDGVIGVLDRARNSFSTSIGLGVERPPPGVESESKPIGRPPPVLEGRGSFKFLQGGQSDPVAYDPCRPIHVVVNTRTGPREALELVEDAIKEVSRLTGLRIILDGTTDEVPSFERPAYQPDRYGERWAPVLVAWTDPSEVADLAGRIAGTGGSTAVRPPGSRRAVYVTGTIALDGPTFEQILGTRRGAYGLALAIVKHEFGHVVGLDHVDDPDELMDSDNSGLIIDFQDGDREGLNKLGQGHCFPQI